MNSNDENNSTSERDWDALAASWTNETSNDTHEKFNGQDIEHHLRRVKREQNKHLIENIIEFALGFILVGLAVQFAISQYEFLPDLDAKVRYWGVNAEPRAFNPVYEHIAFYLFAGVFMFVGMLISAGSFIVRRKNKKSLLAQSESAINRVIINFDLRIRLHQITKWIGLVLFVTFLSVQLLISTSMSGYPAIRLRADYLMLVSVLILQVFPLSICFIGRHFERKTRRAKDRFQSLF